MDGKLATDVAFQVVNGEPSIFQSSLKFFLGVGTLRFGELVFHLGVGGDEIHFLRALEQDFAVDEFVQNAEFEGKRFFQGGGR